jgi:uncharacterized membrane protein YgdD (TMEM256/DUF423 family)
MHTLRIRLSALLGFLSIVLGSMGAHGKVHDVIVAAHELEHWKTAAQYHLPHAVLALLLAIFATRGGKLALWAWRCFIAGLFLFCGSLYLLAYTQVKWLAHVTPFGGLCFMLGWIFIALATWQRETD